jgi:hypothetical protein
MLERTKTIKLICQHLTPSRRRILRLARAALMRGIPHTCNTNNRHNTLSTQIMPTIRRGRCWCRRNNNSARGLGCRFVHCVLAASVLLRVLCKTKSISLLPICICLRAARWVRLVRCVCVVYARIVPGAARRCFGTMP